MTDAHREQVGGLWDEIGALQIDFLRAQGLRPGDTLLDVGCGCLRGGVHFVALPRARAATTGSTTTRSSSARASRSSCRAPASPARLPPTTCS